MPQHDLNDQIEAWAAEMPTDTRAIRAWADRMPRIRSSAPASVDRVIYKTTEQPSPVAQAEQTDTSDAWNAWAEAHVDIARHQARETLEALADEAGAMIGRVENRTHELERRVRELELQLGYENRIRELEAKIASLSADLDADHSRRAAAAIGSTRFALR
jgi:hypothetical protein